MQAPPFLSCCCLLRLHNRRPQHPFPSHRRHLPIPPNCHRVPASDRRDSRTTTRRRHNAAGRLGARGLKAPRSLVARDRLKSVAPARSEAWALTPRARRPMRRAPLVPRALTSLLSGSGRAGSPALPASGLQQRPPARPRLNQRVLVPANPHGQPKPLNGPHPRPRRPAGRAHHPRRNSRSQPLPRHEQPRRLQSRSLAPDRLLHPLPPSPRRRLPLRNEQLREPSAPVKQTNSSAPCSRGPQVPQRLRRHPNPHREPSLPHRPRLRFKHQPR